MAFSVRHVPNCGAIHTCREPQRRKPAWQKRRRATALAACALLALGWSGSVVSVSAASINYGTIGLVPPGVFFIDVTESSGTDAVPLYNPPANFGIGLTFTPTPALSASAVASSADVTDGQLNYTIMAPNVASVHVSEEGLYTLTGAGTALTQAAAVLSVRATVTEIDGVDVAPISLLPSGAMVGFNLLSNSGVDQPWSLAASVNIAASLATLGFGPGQAATKVDVVIDNQLIAIGEPLSEASIRKTRFGFMHALQVPELCSQSLAMAALCIGAYFRRRGTRAVSSSRAACTSF